MKLNLTFILLLFIFKSYSQNSSPQVLNPFGYSFTGGNVVIDISLGEPFIETFQSNGYMFTNGFLQPNYQLLAVNQIVELDNKIKYYPNPTSNFLNIETDIDYSMIKIIDLTGKTVQIFQASLKQISIENLANGLYEVILFRDNITPITNFKISKINY